MGIETAIMAASAAASIAGTAMSAGKKTGGSSTQNQVSDPWKPQQPGLEYGFGEAKRIYDDRVAEGPYTGGFFSPTNDILKDGAAQGAAYAAGPGSNVANTTAGTSTALQAPVGSFVNNATRLSTSNAGAGDPRLTGVLTDYATGAATPGGVSGELSRALEASALRGTQSIMSGQDNIQEAGRRALADPTQATIAAANSYADNPTLNASIAAATRPVLETLHESTVPGLNRAATMGGTLNSSRAGMAEAMANRDAATRVGDIEASMRGAAYNNGLSLAASQREAGTAQAIAAGTAGASAGNNNALGVANLQQDGGQFDTNTRMNAATAGLTTGLAGDALTANTQLAGNQQLGTGISAGVSAGTAAGSQAANNLSMAQSAGGTLQTGEDRALADALARWQMDNGYEAGALKDYWGVLGSQNWGGTQTSTGSTTPPQNPLGEAVGAGLGTASLFAKDGPFEGAGQGIMDLWDSIGPATLRNSGYSP